MQLMPCLKNHPPLWISIKETTHQKVKILSLLSDSTGFLNQPILYVEKHRLHLDTLTLFMLIAIRYS